ncbi:MAG: bifunctional glutamate N-acetyltransferase/amino-acid acetyltransferase ArgJ [Kiritimatiellia bacterium]|nr:bifunctional glutamate N-acetyltransferase/amino-acid acetyltransferase ArgJ [Kiritimatiellia bacterium]
MSGNSEIGKHRGSPGADLPRGFRAAGVAAGLKATGAADMALLVSDSPAAVAALFTTNQVKSATVQLGMDRLRGRVARAVVINSGNANACTGARGLRDARAMARQTAERLAVSESTVFVCSTGTIGRYLPMDTIRSGIDALVPRLSPEGGTEASEAILTTDTRPKRWTVTLKVGRKSVRVTGFCKGAGMIEPNMATMLAFLVTDAAVPAAALQRLLKTAADRSFNRITVDGDRSTNDTVLFFANGQSGAPSLRPGKPGWAAFERAVLEITHQLAMAIVRDGEGATRFITIRVRGARSDRDADLAGRSVANSLLVKTAWAGKNANWGRVMDALGYSAARVRPESVSIRFDHLQAVRGGQPGSATREDLQTILAKPEFTVDIDLHLGRGSAVVYTCNCTEEYVRINV